MDESARRPGLPPEIGVVAVVGAACVPLGRLFREAGPGQLDSGTLQFATLVIAAGVAYGLRRARVPFLLSLAGAVLGFFWFASVLFAPHALAVLFPTPHSISAVLETIRAGLHAVSVEAAPVAPTPGFLALVMLGIWATVWLADDAAIRLRHPLLAIGLTLPLFSMPGTLVRGSRTWIDVPLFLGAALLLLFLDERVRLTRWAGRGVRAWKPGLAARIGVVAVALGVLVSPLLPGYSQPPGGSLRTTGGLRVTVNPLVAVRPSLNESPIADLFTVRSSAPLYWRLTSLDRFNGEVWTATPEAASLPMRRGVARTNPSTNVVSVEQRITVDALAGPWVPAAFEPVRVAGINRVSMQPSTRTMIVSGGYRTGQTFTVVSEVPTPTSEELQADESLDAIDPRYTELPRNLPLIIRQIAERITDGATTRLAKAVALQNYLRTFKYDENVALHHGSSDLVQFLTLVRAGYCEQFSSAMAVMARALGIPARVAVGFGTGDPGNLPGEYNVTSRHAHAWVEVHFPSYGWLTFEPTPRTNGFEPPSYAQTAAAQVPPPVTPTAQPSSTTPSPTAAPSARDRGENLGNNSTRRSGKLPAIPIGVGAILLAIAAAFPGAAALRRRARRSRARTSPEAVGVRYVEFLEWCRTVALARGPGETPLEHAQRLATVAPSGGTAASALASAVTEAVYSGEPEGLDARAAERHARAARVAITPTVGRGRRVAARLGWGWWRSETGR